MNVEVAFLPPMATNLGSRVCVVIDVLRATSTLVCMLRAGAERVILAESIPAALACAADAAERPLLCGETRGLPPQGFDHGNSPREFRPDSLVGTELVMCTSNGTKAMHVVAEAPVVLAASLLNGTAAAQAALREARQRDLDITLVCSGDALGTRFAIDDAFCAGYLVTILEKEARLDLDESAAAAARLYRSYLTDASSSDEPAQPPQEAILRALWESHNARELRRVGLAEDVEFCSQRDVSRLVPRLQLVGKRLLLVRDR